MNELKFTQASSSTFLLTPVVSVYEASTASQLKRKATELLTNKMHNVILNLSRINYMDSFGLASILSILKLCKELGGTLVLLNPNSTVLQLIQLTRLTTILSVVETEAEALALLS